MGTNSQLIPEKSTDSFLNTRVKTVALLWITFLGGALFFSYEIISERAGSLTGVSVLSVFLLSLVALIAGELAVEFSPRIVITVVNLPILIAIVFLGPVPAAIVAAVGVGWMTRKWPTSAVFYNIFVAVIAALAASNFFLFLSNQYSLSTTEVSAQLIAAAAVTALGLQFINMTFMYALGWAKYGENVFSLWRTNFLPALPSQMILIGVGLAILAVYAKAGLIAACLFFAPIFAGQHVFKLLVQQKKLLSEQTNLSQDLMDMNIGLAGALIMLLDSKDHYTASHSAGVAMYCRDMARVMGLSEDDQRIAHMSGLLHDLGKVGTPDAVLKKEGELTPREWELIKEHPTTAAEVLSQLATHKEIADIIRHHQEHFDGSGYPYGLIGEDIPELSRMLAVADTYHALTSNRPYREAKSPFEALVILRRVAGTQLDPKYVEVMALVLKNEDLSYREGSKADFLTEFRKGRPALKLDALKPQAKEK